MDAQIKRYPGYFLSLKGEVFFQGEDGASPEKLKPYKTHEKNTPFVLIPRGNHVEAFLVTPEIMDQYFPDGKIPEAGQRGPANKPLLVFRVDTQAFVAEYATGRAFMTAHPDVGLTNGIPPVAQGKVRMLKGYHIFYRQDVEPYFSTLNAKLDANNVVTTIDFPVELHESRGWSVGKSRKASKAGSVLAEATTI